MKPNGHLLNSVKISVFRFFKPFIYTQKTKDMDNGLLCYTMQQNERIVGQTHFIQFSLTFLLVIYGLPWFDTARTFIYFP